MEEKDVAAVAVLMNKFSAHFDVAPYFQEADVRHWLISRPGVVWGYVVEVKETYYGLELDPKT